MSPDPVKANLSRSVNSNLSRLIKICALQIVAKLDSHGKPWVTKNPRLMLTLPLIKPHLSAPICLLLYLPGCQVRGAAKDC